MWLTSIIGLLTGLGGPIIKLGSNIVDLQRQKADAKTQIAKAEIDARIEETHDRRAVLVAEAGSRLAGGLNASMRFLLTLGPLLVLSKILIWDKVVGSFDGCAGSRGTLDVCSSYRTDILDTNLWWVITAVVGFYFVTSTASILKK